MSKYRFENNICLLLKIDLQSYIFCLKLCLTVVCRPLKCITIGFIQSAFSRLFNCSVRGCALASPLDEWGEWLVNDMHSMPGGLVRFGYIKIANQNGKETEKREIERRAILRKYWLQRTYALGHCWLTRKLCSWYKILSCKASSLDIISFQVPQFEFMMLIHMKTRWLMPPLHMMADIYCHSKLAVSGFPRYLCLSLFSESVPPPSTPIKLANSKLFSSNDSLLNHNRSLI